MSRVRVGCASFVASTILAGVVILVAQGQPPAEPQMRGDGPSPTAKPFNITRADPELDTVVSPKAKLETLAGGFGINEGVLWIRDGNSGYVLVSSLIDNVMSRSRPTVKSPSSWRRPDTVATTPTTLACRREPAEHT